VEVPVALCHLEIHAAFFRHSTRLTTAAIRSELGAGDRSSRVNTDLVPREPHPDQVIQRHLGPGITQGVVGAGRGLDGPHHHQPLLRPVAAVELRLHPARHRIHLEPPPLVGTDHQLIPNRMDHCPFREPSRAEIPG
jgi:hypothetical protein